MTKEDYIRLGFAPLQHYTVADALLYQLGRNRHLSAGCVGTPNEMIWICQMDDKDTRKCEDLVCLHNYDYDGYMTEAKLQLLIKALSGGVDRSTESVGENGVLHSVVFSEERAEVCDCTHTQACKICGEEKGLDGDFWKNLKQT
jgi:hypothetical protein